MIAALSSLCQGSVSKVKKKLSARGGSARPENIKQPKTEHRLCCFPFLTSLLDLTTNAKQDGKSLLVDPVNALVESDRTDVTDDMSNLSQNPWPRQVKTSNRHKFLQQDSRMGDSTIPELCQSPPKGTMTLLSDDDTPADMMLSTGSLITYGTKKDMNFALKSLILDRCSKKHLQEELRNEGTLPRRHSLTTLLTLPFMCEKVELLKELDHPNIVRVFESFYYKKRLYIVLELCSGGDLYTRDPYAEDDAHRIVRSLFRAVSYLHSKGIVHRDLKFENCLFVSKSKQAAVRIIDFGLSQKFAKSEFLHAAVGTAYTMAPEQIQGRYNEKIDVWALGVIAFMLLSSSLPFFGRDKLYVMKKILQGKFSFSSKRWKNVSDEAKEFITSVLMRDPTSRPSAEDALNLPWLSTPRANAAAHTIDQWDDILTSIKAYSSYGTLKRLALMVVAYKSTSDEIGFLRTSFVKFDKSNDGEICFEEFRDALSENYTYSDEEMRELYKAIDFDETGKVHYMEFLAAAIEGRGAIDEERLAEAFDRIDTDDSGYITIRDLRDFLGKDLPQSLLERMIDEADVNDDRKVSYNEFLGLWEDDTAFQSAREEVNSRRLSSSMDADLGKELDNMEDGTDFFDLQKVMSCRNEKISDVTSRSEL